ncbi:hypothetical protein [Mesorhizobium sp. SP-1A]|uniref:hypothetical protein n=1 Tax=Mesorhizobium sp. SP-1A TaxID=3077840 RepID=UPI0028F6E031|nr:hypothetical protein [Mesorhizobium sp. SP-1A]
MGKIPVVGTTVKIDLDKGERGWANKGIQHGSVVKVVEYSQIHYGRTCGHDKGGLYENDSYALVENDKGTRFQIWTPSLAAIDGVSEMMDKRSKEERRIGDLPDTKFWEMDIVMDEEGEIFKIQHIWYDQIGEFCNDGVTPMPIYACGTDGNGYSHRREGSLTLVERGNVWKRAHGEEMAFASTKEEIDFYILVGDIQYMKNPRLTTGQYHWPQLDALESIRDGYGDYCFGTSHSVVKFDDPKIGEMARDYWLKHNDPKYDWLVS